MTNTTQPFVSALVVAHNEEQRLQSCLEKLSFCHEIVVVLDKCTDNSKKIASQFTDKLIEGSWEREGERRNIGINACQGPWILEIDADEHVSPEMATEIIHTINTATADYYLVPLYNYIGTRLVENGWGASFGVRNDWALFKKGCKIWHNQRVHPQVTFHGLRGHRIKHGYNHYVDDNITDMIIRLNRYTSAKALDMLDNPHWNRLWPNIRRFFSRFWQCYIRRKGYKEGIYGICIAMCAGLFPLLSYLKYQEHKLHEHNK